MFSRRMWAMLVGVTAAALGVNAQAALIAADDFESYTSGAQLAGQGSAVDGWTSSWNTTSTAVTVQGTAVPGFGSGIQVSATDAEFQNLLSRSFDSQTGDLYVGLQFRTTGVWDGSDFIQFYVNNTVTSSSGTGLSGGVRNTASSAYFARVISTSDNASTTHADDVTMQMVLKFTKSGATYNQTELWLNQLVEGAPDASIILDSTIDTLSVFHVRMLTTSDTELTFLDNIRIGTEYADVVAVPEPSTWALLGLVGLAGAAWGRRRKAG